MSNIKPETYFISFYNCDEKLISNFASNSLEELTRQFLTNIIENMPEILYDIGRIDSNNCNFHQDRKYYYEEYEELDTYLSNSGFHFYSSKITTEDKNDLIENICNFLIKKYNFKDDKLENNK